MDQTRPSRVLWLFGGLALFTVLLPVAGLCLAYLEPPGLFGAPTLSFERVWPLLGRSLALSTSVSILSLVAGTTLAWAEVRTAYAGRRILSLLSTLALATPSYLIATILREQMAPAGGLGHLMGTTEAFTGFWPAVLVLTVACTPYVHLLTAAALRRCPPAEEEAARSLGAGQWRVLSTIIAPRLRSTWAFALALVGLYVISDFGAVAILDCEVLTWELYKARDGHEAVTLGFGLMFVVFPLLVGVRLLSRQTFDERSVTQRQVERRALKGSGLCVVLLLHVLVIGLGVALPIGSLTNWVWQGLSHHVQFAPVTGPAITTLVLAGFCTTVVVIVSGVVAYLAVQTRPKTAGLIENMVYLTSSLPGVLVAVGILKLIIGIKREAPWTGWVWFETLGLFLLVGYCMRFLSQGFAAM
ncbi:MAG: ABC transporter permease, partial [Bradymonadia bacterium]